MTSQRVRVRRLVGLLLSVLCCSVAVEGGAANAPEPGPSNVTFLKLQTGDKTIDQAFRIALGDLFSNVQDHRVPLLNAVTPLILAGLDYNSPWTRDAAINCWNVGSLVMPDIARNTLLSRVSGKPGSLLIADKGNYWDAIIWSIGAWNHYLCTGDRVFLATAYEVTVNTLRFYEETEFNAPYGLFRGLGWSDGVAAFEGKYANTGGSSAAIDWVKHNPGKLSKPGVGIPMMALSTNCLYYQAYAVAERMRKALGRDAQDFDRKAAKLKTAINRHLWNEKTGMYKFYIDEDEESNLQETLGNAYAIIFGIADKEKAGVLITNQQVTPAGVPCGWPPLTRYHTDSMTFARHNAVVWPQIQGFWVEALSLHQQSEKLWHEVSALARHAVRDMQFGEIYHPITGEMYGGMQEIYKGTPEKNGPVVLWKATNRQTWAATAFHRMVIFGLLGARVDESGIRFAPCIPKHFKQVELSNLRFRDMTIQIKIVGAGTAIKSARVNGKKSESASLNHSLKGAQQLELEVR